MPITKSAKKALRASKRKKVFNDRRKQTMKDTVKKIEKLVKSGNKEEAKGLLSTAYKAIDKAAKKGVVKKKEITQLKLADS